MTTLVENSAAYAAVVAQLVPILLLAALTIPLRLERGVEDRPKALGDVIVTGVLVGAGLLAMTVSLFGVAQGGLTSRDRGLMTALVVLTGFLAGFRLLAPVARSYADDAKIPEVRVWWWLAGLIIGSFVGLLVWLT